MLCYVSEQIFTNFGNFNDLRLRNCGLAKNFKNDVLFKLMLRVKRDEELRRVQIRGDGEIESQVLFTGDIL